MKIPFLSSNIRALQFFQLFRFVILFGIGIGFAQAGLPTETIGIFEKFIFLAGAISFFWVNGLTQSMLSLSGKYLKNNEEKSPLFFHVFFVAFCFTALTLILLLLLEQPLAQFFLNSSSIPYILPFIAYFLFSTPAFVVEFFYLLKKKPGAIVTYGILTFSLQFILLLAPILLSLDLEYSLWGLAAISFIRFLWTLQIIFRFSAFRFSGTFIRELLHHSAPLIFMTLISGSLPYIDGILVANYFDDSTFAIYRYGAREFPLTLLMANALSNAMVPEFSDPDSRTAAFGRIKQHSLKLMHLFFPASIVMLFFSRELYPLLFNKDFIAASSVFNILLLLIISRLVFPQTILLGYGKSRILLVGSSIEFAVKIIVSIVLIKQMGIYGIALATVAAFITEKVFLVFSISRKIHIKAGDYIPVVWLLFYSTLLIAAFLFAEYSVIFPMK